MSEIVEEVKAKIPVAVMSNLLLAAARGFRAEDPHNMVEMDSEEFTFFSRLITRGLCQHDENSMKVWALEELEFFWSMFDPHKNGIENDIPADPEPAS